jgi:predicted hydrocarbon binding protein
MEYTMNSFNALKNSLKINDKNQLIMNKFPMILMPRLFFGRIQKGMEDVVGSKITAQVYYNAAYNGAYNWGKMHIEQEGLSDKHVIEHYISSMSLRGWGRFEVDHMAPNKGIGLFRLHNSAIGQELGVTGAMVCLWVPGALAGAFQIILDKAQIPIKVAGRELRCISSGAEYCEFEVAPEHS